MGLTREQLDKVLAANATASTDAWSAGVKRNADAEQNQMQRDAALSQLIKGKQMEQEGETAKISQQSQIANDAFERAKQYVSDEAKAGRRVSAQLGSQGATITQQQEDPLKYLLKQKNEKPQLTPGQIEAEKTAGKKIAEYQGGGRAASESNIGQLQGVANELQSGKRDAWDQRVGGLLENHPTLMSVFSPTEKARRDRVQNSMLSMLHDAGIPRPTQWDIQRVFGQVYDSAADDKTNLARIMDAVSKMHSHQSAMDDQANRYGQTGYATVGQGAPAPQATQPHQGRVPTFEEWKRMKAGR